MRTVTALAAVCLTAASATLFTGSPVEAQSGTQSFRDAQFADLQQMGEKFGALAEAFPESMYDWAPMDSVRSVRDVMGLIAAEGVLFPTMWGYDAPAWAASGGFGPELARLGALSKADLIAEIERSFNHVTTLVEEMSDADRARPVNFFGRQVNLATAINLMANDMHEHLGQSIAYARMNHIVPPWSR